MHKSQEEKRNRKRKRGIKSSIADSYFEYGDDYDPILRSECYFSTCAQANRLATVKMQYNCAHFMNEIQKERKKEKVRHQNATK